MAIAAVTAGRKGDWITATWAAAATGDTFAPFYMNANVADCWIEASGTFSGGTSIGLNGYVLTAAAVKALVDVDGTTIALTAASSSTVRDVPPFLVPTIASGSSDSVVVVMYFKVVR